MNVRARVLVSGRVQGVFYRAHVKGAAEKHGMMGWVKNLPDGRVEILMEGKSGSFEDLVEALRMGPPLSSVDKIKVKYEPYGGDLQGFHIEY